MKRTMGATLFLLPEVFRSPGGIQNYNRDQIQAFRRSGLESALSVLVLNDRPEDLACEEWCRIETQAYSARKATFAVGAALTARRRRAVRIILGHRHFLPLVAGLKLAAPRSRIWLMLYGVEAWRGVSVAERIWLKGVSRIFAISPYTLKQAERAGFPAPVELWPCGLPFHFQLPEPIPPRLESPAKLLAVCRLSGAEGYKGVDHTIQALGILQRRGVLARLDVVGDGDDRPRLEALSEAEDVKGLVRFHGQVSDLALRKAYGGCDLFVLPSGGEGFGIVYLEAMAYGKPVVAADAAATPFVVRPGESGDLVPFGAPESLANRLQTIISDPQKARADGSRGRRFLEKHFTFDRFVARCKEIVSEEERGDGCGCCS